MDSQPAVDRNRFTGFAGLYDTVRPRPPQKAADILLAYLRRDRARAVADLGSGTGLSTALWRGRADRIVGIEPTPDMRRRAAVAHPDLEFRDGTSYATGLPDGWADVVTCSQSFHWMEPRATLAEAARILGPGGVFAAYDCRWPVAWDWEAERAYLRLFDRAGEVSAGLGPAGNGPVSYPKGRHRENLEASGLFRHVTEVLFDSEEPCDADRFTAIALSQGHIQSLLKTGTTALDGALEEFRRTCRGSRAEVMRVSYQMIVGVL